MPQLTSSTAVLAEKGSPVEDGTGLPGSPAVHRWEEPHPGRRLSYPMETTASWVAGLHRTDGGCGGDMTAEEYDDHCRRHEERSGLVRRPIRARTRDPTSKSKSKLLTIPTHVPRERETRNAHLPARPRLGLAHDSPAPSPLSASTVGCAAQAMEVDTDTDTEIGTQPSTDERHGDELRGWKTSTPQALCFTDYSGILQIQAGAQDDDTRSVTVVDGEIYCHPAQAEDLYGWEAELDRKAALGILAPNFGRPCPCDRLQYRRANGARRNLMRRVFSLGAAKEENILSNHCGR